MEDALKGCKMVIPERAEKTKSPELLARLAKLQRQEDDRKYNAMVADITKAVNPTTHQNSSFSGTYNADQ